MGGCDNCRRVRSGENGWFGTINRIASSSSSSSSSSSNTSGGKKSTNNTNTSNGNGNGSHSNSVEVQDLTVELRWLLHAVKSTGGRFGMGLPVDIVRGSRSEKVLSRFPSAPSWPCFGKGKASQG